MMVIYDKNCQDFHNNGLGFLTDCLSASVEEEINGGLSLKFEYPVNGFNSQYITYDNIIKCDTGRKKDQLFIIKNIVKNFKSISVTCLHIFYVLKDNHIDNVAPTNLAAEDFCNWFLQRTNFSNQFNVRSIINERKSARYVNKNPVECFLGDIDNSVIKLFNAEIDRDNFTINVVDKIGENNHVKLIIGKNIDDIQISTDASSIYTRIYPQGANGLTLPEKYVDSDLINTYPTPKVGTIEFSDIAYDPNDENSYHTLDEAYDALRSRSKELFDSGADKPVINIKIDWLELSKTKEYYDKYANLERVLLGDTIYAQILGLNYETRVMKTTYNVLTDRIEKFEIGTISATISSKINSLTKNVERISPSSILQQAKQSATELLTNALGGYVLKTQNELFIMDTDNPETCQKVWRWNINGLGYSKNGIDGPYETAITQDGQIVADFITTGKLNTDVIEGYNELLLVVESLKKDVSKISSIEINIDNIIEQIKYFNDQSENIAKLELSINKIEQTIGSISDMTKSSESTIAICDDLDSIHESEPITIRIHPINENISYLYPYGGLFPSENTFMKTRTLRFHNKTTDEDIDYVLPDDLFYYDDDFYDEFRLDYESEICQIIKKCYLDADGNVQKLEKTEIENFEYPHNKINLTAGDYSVSLLGYNSAYLYVRLMVSNIYTSQFATTVELRSRITQTEQSITESVDAQFTDVNGELKQVHGEVGLKIDKGDTGEVVSALNLAVDLLEIHSRNFTLEKTGTITAKAGVIGGCSIVNNVLQVGNANILSIDAGKITTGTMSADRIYGGTINGSVVNVTNLNASNIKSGTMSADRIYGGTINGSVVNVTNLNASNITSGTFSASRISGGTINTSNLVCGSYVKIYSGGHFELSNNTNNGGGFFAMGPAYGSVPNIVHPYASALNLCYGSGLGISFRSSQSVTSTGSPVGYVRVCPDSYRKATYQMNIAADQGVEIASLDRASIYLWTVIELNAYSNHSVWAKGTNLSSARVVTTAGNASSRCLKENIQKFTNVDYEDAYKLLQDLDICSYDYKYRLYNDKHQYGFIIDDLENLENSDKFFRFNTLYAKVNGDFLDPTVMEKDDFDENNLPDDYLKYKEYNSDVFTKYLLTCLKAIQQKIDGFELLIKEGNNERKTIESDN